MPYDIKKKGSGYVVTSGKRTFSNNPLPLNVARKQRIAIALSEAKKTGKDPSSFFGK